MEKLSELETRLNKLGKFYQLGTDNHCFEFI